MERRHIVTVLESTGWRVSGKGGAAEVLGLKRTTLQAKMEKLGIKRSNKTDAELTSFANISAHTLDPSVVTITPLFVTILLITAA